MQAASEELRELDRDLAQVETMRRQLAEYFCEDETTFKLDDCITTFNSFFDSFRKAVDVSWTPISYTLFTAERDLRTEIT